jgi:hypothetical protein
LSEAPGCSVDVTFNLFQPVAIPVKIAEARPPVNRDTTSVACIYLPLPVWFPIVLVFKKFCLYLLIVITKTGKIRILIYKNHEKNQSVF